LIKSRKGFTLMELLTCIVLIIIVSAVTMFSTLEMTASAEANNVINNMYQIKAATIMWYKENLSRIVRSGDDYKIITKTSSGKQEQWFSDFIDSYGSDEIMKYLKSGTDIVIRSKNSSANNTGDYSLIATNNSTKWYVCYNTGTVRDNSDLDAPIMRMKKKFAGRAKVKDEIKFYGKSELKGDTFLGCYTDQKFVCMEILSFTK